MHSRTSSTKRIALAALAACLAVGAVVRAERARKTRTSPPVLVIEIPGVRHVGEAGQKNRDAGSRGGEVRILVCHKGAKLSWNKWETRGYHHVVTLEDSSLGELRKLDGAVQEATKRGKPVRVVVDKNITLTGHIRGKPDEDKWAAAVADHIAASAATRGYVKLVFTHSNGTQSPGHMTRADQVDCVVLSSPRGRKAAEFLESHPAVPTVILLGKGDFGALGGGEEEIRQLASRRASAVVIRLEDGGSAEDVHSHLATMSHEGTWSVQIKGYRFTVHGTLGELLARMVKALAQRGKPSGKCYPILAGRHSRTQSHIVAGMVRQDQTVLVVGKSFQAYKTYHALVNKHGKENVFWVNATADRDEAEFLAAFFEADRVLWFTDKVGDAPPDDPPGTAPCYLVHADGPAETAGRIVTGFVKKGQRVLVVGRGEVADRMARELAERPGRENVVRLDAWVPPDQIAHFAQVHRADVVVGVTNRPHEVGYGVELEGSGPGAGGKADDGREEGPWEFRGDPKNPGWLLARRSGQSNSRATPILQAGRMSAEDIVKAVDKRKSRENPDEEVNVILYGDPNSKRARRVAAALAGKKGYRYILLVYKGKVYAYDEKTGRFVETNETVDADADANSQTASTGETIGGSVLSANLEGSDDESDGDSSGRRPDKPGQNPAPSDTVGQGPTTRPCRPGRPAMAVIRQPAVAPPVIPRRSPPSPPGGGTSPVHRMRPVPDPVHQRPHIPPVRRLAPRRTERISPPPRRLAPRPAMVGRIGGVMLHGCARPAGDDGEKTEVDLADGTFSLVVEGKGAHLEAKAYRRFLTALWAVYFTRQAPGISIDPIAPGAKKHLVRYIGKVVNSDLGRVMREADYKMKQWAVGTDRPGISGFHDVDALTARHGARLLGVPRRFWFVPENMRFRRAGGLILFDTGRMTVKTAYASEGNTGKAEAAFAQFFTDHYRRIAARHPVFDELFEYARMVSLAKHLKDSRTPLLWFLLANRDQVLTEDSPGTVDALAKGSNHFRGMYIEGGVNLRSHSRYVYDRQAAAAVAKVLASRPPARSSRPASASTAAASPAPQPLSLDLPDRSYTVLPPHRLVGGKDRRGREYQTDFALRRDGGPGLELVRWRDPRGRADGHFGTGWRLLVPYRVRPHGSARRRFLNAVIPQNMAVENLLTGEREVLTFRTDRYSLAGYVPDRAHASRLVGLFLMSNASYRLTDKLGNQFWFDPRGDLTDMIFSPQYHVHIEYEDGLSRAFETPPYSVRPASQQRVSFLGVRIPEQMRITRLADGRSETLPFSGTGGVAEYAPAEGDRSAFRVLALTSGGRFLLVDKKGHRVLFDEGGRFVALAPSATGRMVRSVALGEQTVSFLYTVDASGAVRISAARLAAEAGKTIAVVRYEYDSRGGLLAVRRHRLPAAAG